MNNPESFNYTQKEVLEEARQVAEFLSVLKLFTAFDYSERVKYMKEHWGENKAGKAIYYGKYCKVLITFEKDGQYHFSFESENFDFRKFEEQFGELAELMRKNDIEQIKRLYPGIVDFNCPEPSEVALPEADCSTDYLSAYNNITINKPNSTPKQK